MEKTLELLRGLNKIVLDEKQPDERRLAASRLGLAIAKDYKKNRIPEN